MTVSSPHHVDDIDKTILDILQAEGRIANAELARRINLSPPAAHTRIKRLEQDGHIQGYAALLDRDLAGYDLLCFVRVSLERHQTAQVDNFRSAVQQMSEVMECHFVTGDFDYLLKVVAHNRRDLERFLVDRLTPIEGVAHVVTNIVLSEIKSTTALPL